MKSYTDLKQSEILSKILKHESADMSYYIWKDDGHLMSPVPFVLDGTEEKEDGMFEYIPCWSLSALLSVIPNYKISIEHNYYTCTAVTSFGKETVGWFDNPIDSCVELILKLKEKNLL